MREQSKDIKRDKDVPTLNHLWIIPTSFYDNKISFLFTRKTKKIQQKPIFFFEKW